MFHIGDDIAGYRVEQMLGAGGMGEVYRASHPRLPRSDAIKVLRSAHAEDPVVRQRFEREADLLAPISHPNLVRVYDRGAFGDLLWIAMELVPGTDASKMSHASPGGMDPRLVVNIVNGVAAGLDIAHRHGVLHRDVKPANILITPGDDPVMPAAVKVTDFGIAQALGDTSPGLTVTGTAVGTLRYSAPEQISGSGVDGRADVYALAATTFELLTGAAPFFSDSPHGLMSAHLYDSPPRASERNPRLSKAVDDVLIAGMAKNPAARPPTATAFAWSLFTAFTAGTATVPAGLSSAATGPTAPGQAAFAAPGSAPRWFQKLPVLASIAVVAALVAGIGGGYLWSSMSGLDTPSGVHAKATAKGVDVGWDAVAGAAHYVVKQDGNVIQTVKGTAVTIAGVFPGEHTYAVAAQSTTDKQSEFSNDVSVTAVQTWGLMSDTVKLFPDLLPTTPVSTDGYGGLTCTATGPIPDAINPAAMIDCKKEIGEDSWDYKVRVLIYADRSAAVGDTFRRVGKGKDEFNVQSAKGTGGNVTTGVSADGTARSEWEFSRDDPRANMLVEVVYPISRDVNKARDLIGKLPF